VLSGHPSRQSKNAAKAGSPAARDSGLASDLYFATCGLTGCIVTASISWATAYSPSWFRAQNDVDRGAGRLLSMLQAAHAAGHVVAGDLAGLVEGRHRPERFVLTVLGSPRSALQSRDPHRLAAVRTPGGVGGWSVCLGWSFMTPRLIAPSCPESK
jgi:hypothetical protein